MVFVWFFFNLGFVAFFVQLLALNDVFVVYGTGQGELSGYVWMLVGCLALAFVFAAPRRSRS